MAVCGCSDPGGQSRGEFVYRFLGNTPVVLSTMKDPASVVAARIAGLANARIRPEPAPSVMHQPVRAHYVGPPSAPPSATCC